MTAELSQALKVVLANHYAVSLKAQFYHWNVTGPNFSQNHIFFGNIYEETSGAIDRIAEEIRSLNVYSPGSLEQFARMSQLTGEESASVPATDVMFQRLLNDISIVSASCMVVYGLAEQEGCHNISNFMAERQDAFNKHMWMIRSTLEA
jgi:starvation-inducible DNA-binding protein